MRVDFISLEQLYQSEKIFQTLLHAEANPMENYEFGFRSMIEELHSVMSIGVSSYHLRYPTIASVTNADFKISKC